MARKSSKINQRGCFGSLFLYMNAYRSFADYLKQKFGERVQKISVNGGFTCPNRDGTKGIGGCVYCDNVSFSPVFENSFMPINEQIEFGINYFKKKYPTQKYIAYFQNFSNTYAPIEVLRKKYYEALEHPQVVGIAVSTRPDCIDNDVIHLLEEINKSHSVFVELGLESTHNSTLSQLHRCHTYEDFTTAVYRLSEKQLWTTVHMILGLPNEDKSDVVIHAKQLSLLPLQAVKLHQLQIIKGTKLADLFLKKQINYSSLTIHDFIDWVIAFLEHLNPTFYIERFTSESPSDMVLSPKWGPVKNYHVVEMIRKKMLELGTYQGRMFELK